MQQQHLRLMSSQPPFPIGLHVNWQASDYPISRGSLFESLSFSRETATVYWDIRCRSSEVPSVLKRRLFVTTPSHDHALIHGI